RNLYEVEREGRRLHGTFLKGLIVALGAGHGFELEFGHTGALLRVSCMSRNVCGTSPARRASCSAAIAAEALGSCQRVLEPRKREIVNDDILYRLENLELMPLVVLGPEHHHGLKRRTARKSAGDFRDQDDSRFAELKAFTRPGTYPTKRLAVLGTLHQW